jgi:hypothetical protein
MGSAAVACLPAAVSLLLLEALFMEISGVSLALTWSCRHCLLRFLLCVSLCYKLSPFQALGKVTLHLHSQAWSMSSQAVWAPATGGPGALLVSLFNVKWRCSAQAGGVEGSKLCLFSVILPAKCVSSISPRFHYRRLAFCFLPLAAILMVMLVCSRNPSLSLPQNRNNTGRKEEVILEMSVEGSLCRCSMIPLNLLQKWWSNIHISFKFFLKIVNFHLLFYRYKKKI